MTFEQATAFFLFAFVAAITPGPANVLLTATGAQVGVLRGLPCAFGVSAGMGSMMFLAAYGLGSLVLAHAPVLMAVKICGAVFLFWLAWKITTSGPAGEEQSAQPVGFFGAAALQWVNPKAWLVSAGAVATYLSPEGGTAAVQSAFFALVFMSAPFPSNLIWLAFGAAAHRLLRDDRRRRAFNIVMGVALALSVAPILR